MSPKTVSSVEGFDAFEAEIMAQDKKWRAILWIAALAFLASVSIAFLVTMQELGSMNAHVSGVFGNEDTQTEAVLAYPDPQAARLKDQSQSKAAPEDADP